ncbi:hypothetical protein ACUXV3_12395 [Roseobacteraceae bacterium NS-SX3]
MKSFAALAAAAALACTAAQAETAWKDEALREIKTLQKVADGRWAESGALWLSAYPTRDDLRIYTETAVCAQLHFAGKPKGEEVLVRWFSAQAIAQGQLKRVATAWCE